MEDEEEIRSRASPAGSDSPDPSSSPPVGRVTVTVASAGPPTYSPAPPASSSQHDPNALALALPVQAGGSGGGNSNNGRASGGGREDCWSEGATAVLIDAWGERYLELSRGNLKQKHWKEVAEIVSSSDDYGKTPKTDIQCKNRIDTVKKKYKQEKARMAAGGGSSRWIFFDKLHRLIGSTARIPTASPSSGSGGGGSSQKIPMGIPMSSRTNLYQQQGKATTPPIEKHRLIGATTARIPTASLSSGGGGGSGGGGPQNVPMGIPMGSRSNLYQQPGKTPQPPLQQGIVKRCNESKRWRFKKRDASDSESESEPEMSADSADSLPPPPPPKRVKMEKKKEGGGGGGGGGGGNKWAELTRAILRFGEAYEQAETAKLQQVVEMEKERMKFLKELELQRMQFFVKTQLEISQLRQHGRRRNGGGGGNGNTSNDHSGKNNNDNIAAVNNNSDVSN